MEIELYLKMYSHSNQIPQGYYSLNNSIVLSPSHTHTRTQSTSRNTPNLTFKPEHTRVPSQKKLTLTCQNPSLLTRPPNKQIENGLKKRGGECKGKFVSLQASRVGEVEILGTRRQNESESMIELKRMFRDKLRQLQTAYSHSLSECSNNIRQLQMKLLNNSRDLQAKQRKITQLQTLCKGYQSRLKDKSMTHNTGYLSQRIADLQAKIKVLVNQLDEDKDISQAKVELLTKKIVSHFGTKLQRIRHRTDQLLENNLNKISDLQSQIEMLKLRHQKHSEGTRESMQSVCSEPNFNFQPNQDQGSMSFWDDCFFYPSEHSENYDLVLEMSKRRQQPLSLWIDQQEYLRYSDTDSYLYNLKGDRIRLPREELIELISQKVINII